MAQDEDIENHDPMEKDATEAELEKLVFGNDAGFREGIKSHIRETQHFDLDHDDQEEDIERDEGKGESDEDLEALDDSEVCVRMR